MTIYTWIDLIVVLSLLGLGLFIGLGIIVCLLFLWPRFKEFLQTKSFFRNLVVNQVIGLSLLSLIFFLTPIIPSSVELQDYTLDFVMSLYRGNIPPRTEKFPAFVLLDIDDETHQSWGSPALTPRDKLTNLIDVAVKAKARLIVVDIALREPTNKEGPLHVNDQKLVTYLKNYVVQCQTEKDKSRCPPIILVRTLSKIATEFSPAIPHVNFLDEAGVIQAKPYLQRASVQFSSSKLDPNQNDRYWRLWEPICAEDKPDILPSVVLLTTAIIKGCTDKMQMALTSVQPQSCDKNKTSLPKSLNFCSLSISTDFLDIEQRVMYRIPWLVGGKPPTLPYVAYDNLGEPILTIFSAKPYAESPSQANLEPLNDKIVVIGGSYGGHDVYPTPIGDMPGALTIINSIHTLLQGITIKPVSFSIWFGIGFGFIFIFTIFSYGLSDKWKSLGWVALAIIIAGLSYYTVIFFDDGTWLNFAVPLVIIKLFHFFYQKPWLRELAVLLFNWGCDLLKFVIGLFKTFLTKNS